MSSKDEPRGISVPITWLGPEDVPILYANAFVSQFDPQNFDSLILTVGQMTPPAIMGATPEEREEQARNVAFVAVKPVVRLGLTIARARELMATLGANLDQLDEVNKVRSKDPRE
jgi:hypothetical protein